MRNFKAVLAYDGGRYNGWQKQGNTENTIQERLERILTELCGETIEVHGAGRTDAGTHATGQVMHFHTNRQETSERLLEGCNARLPEDIAILSMEEVSMRFHSRLSATGKHYAYTIWKGRYSPVFWRRYVFRCEPTLDIAAMRQAAWCFVGEHDFRSFCANKRMKKTTVRRIHRIDFEDTEDRLTLHFYGNGFLYQMIRILVGTLIEVGEGKRVPEEMTQILQAKNRERAGFTAPSRGLCLREVFYKKEESEKEQ